MAPATYRSSAGPLALAWLALIVYASLHPFSPWSWPSHINGAEGLKLLWLPVTPSSRFDLWSNFLAYQPLGLLLAISRLRAGQARAVSWLFATLVGVLLSLTLEELQHLLPQRVPSRIDWALNSAGSAVGAALALLIHHLGGLRYWQQLRDRWFVPHGTAGLALLLSWPISLLFPPPAPLGLGQGLGRLAVLVDGWLADTAAAGWIPLPDPQVVAEPLPPGMELLVITLGQLAPCWVAFVMSRRPLHRLVMLAGALVLGPAATTLSNALNFGPEHALTWLSPPVGPALASAALLGVGLAWLPRQQVAALGLIAITALIALVNQAGVDPYFWLSLQAWEQGRFIRFHGLAQWIGWLWPFAALLFLLAQAGRRPGHRDESTSTIGP